MIAKALPGLLGTFRKPLEASKVCCVILLSLSQFLLVYPHFDLCQRMKYFCHVKEPLMGIFPLERNTSTNYTLDEFQAMHLPFGLPVAPREGKTCFHRLIILLESPPQSSGVLLLLVSPPVRATHPSVRPLAPAACW